MRPAISALVLSLVIVALASTSAVADPACGETYDLGGASRTCVYSGSDTVEIFATSGSDGHTYSVRPQCSGEETGQSVCTETQSCPADDGELGSLMSLYRDGVLYGTTCLSDTQAGDLGVITPGRVLREFQRLTWPQSPLTIQPPGGKTAVNFTTYYFTENVAPTTQTVEIIGQQVEIEATPTSYVYRFDADSTVETRSPGGPYPSGDVTHEYPYKGRASPSIDTVYSGRYRVNGGAWNDIPETVTVEGTPVTLRIVEVRPTLVAPAAP
jgi:hypothetical protein